MDDFSILHLYNGNWNKESKQKFITRVSGGIDIVQETKVYNAAASAYIISRKYAEFLMKRFFPIRDPQDIMMGWYVNRGKHLSLKMSKKDDCYISPLLDMPCDGDGGTGSQTTQEYSAPGIKTRWSCAKCQELHIKPECPLRLFAAQ